MLTVYIDFKSAQAYLALIARLWRWQNALVWSLNWQPFRAVERDVPKLGDEETVGESHRRVRAASQRALAIKYAAHQALDFKSTRVRSVRAISRSAHSQLIEGDRLPFIQSGV